MMARMKKFDSTETHDAGKIQGAAVKNAKMMTVPATLKAGEKVERSTSMVSPRESGVSLIQCAFASEESSGPNGEDDEEEDVASQYLVGRIEVRPELLGDSERDATDQRAPER